MSHSPTTMSGPDADQEAGKELRREFSRFAAYLIGRDPPRAMADRYAGYLAAQSALGISSSALRAVQRNPRLLPWLDAACGFLRPRDPLRQRLLLCAAILEASVEFADDFLPRPQSRARILLEVLGGGVSGVGRLLLGAPLLLVLEKREARPE